MNLARYALVHLENGFLRHSSGGADHWIEDFGLYDIRKARNIIRDSTSKHLLVVDAVWRGGGGPFEFRSFHSRNERLVFKFKANYCDNKSESLNHIVVGIRVRRVSPRSP